MMRLPRFRYLAPRSLSEATAALADQGPDAALLAGGTDLFPSMKRRQQSPATVIGLREIAALHDRSIDERGLTLGALTPLSALESDSSIVRAWPALSRAASLVATPPLRNMGTVGGNLCLDTRCTYYDQGPEWRQAIGYCMKKDGDICWVAPGSPRCWAVSSSDTAPVLCALGAEVTLVSKAGERRIAASELFADDGIQHLTRRPDEILARVHVPAPAAGQRSVYLKLRRRGSFDFPVLGIAVRARLDAGGLIESARIFVSGTGSRPHEAQAASNFLAGKPLDDEVIVQAARLIAHIAKPLHNTDFSLGWRKSVAREYAARALRELARPEPGSGSLLQLPGLSVDRSRSPSALTFSPGFNAASVFIDRHLSEGRGAKVAIRCADGDVTYAELVASVNRCGVALRRLGLAPGQRVLMIVKDCPEFFYLFWGAIKAGIIPVPINVILRAADYRVMIEDSGCSAVIYSPEFASEVEPAVSGGSLLALPIAGAERCLRALLAAAPPELEPVPAEATAPCFWLYTSGSTGRPKGAVHCHRDMVVTSELFGRGVLGIQPDEIIFSAAKLFFAYGLGNAMTFPLWAGATSVLLDARPTATNTLQTIERSRPTLYFGVPTLYAAQLQALESLRPDLSSLRLCVSAGEPLPAELLRRWKEQTGRTILDGLGSTEALNTFLSNRPDDVRPGTSGKPVPGYAVRILSPAGDEAAPNEQGRLHVQGDSIATCYWNNPEKTAEALRDGWLDTGDTYFRDEDGYYHYCGRSDDMLKVGGMWCSPIEIESRLVSHPGVLEAAVAGRADESGNVKPEAWVVLRQPAAASEALASELMLHCKSYLAPYKFPRRVHFVADLPKTATGKIQRYLLRRLAPT